MSSSDVVSSEASAGLGRGRKRSLAESTHPDTCRSSNRSSNRSTGRPAKRQRRLPSTAHRAESDDNDDNDTDSSVITSESPTSSIASQPSLSPQRPNIRHSRDGFDLRRPVMTVPNIISQTIDLTAEDDDTSPVPATRTRTPTARASTPPTTRRRSARPEIPSNRGPPFITAPVNVINISDSSDDEADGLPLARRTVGSRTPRLARPSSSPDVEFVDERIAPTTSGNQAVLQHHNFQDPAPAVQPPHGDRHAFRAILRRGADLMYNLHPGNLIGNRPAMPRHAIDLDLALEPADNFDDLQFNYQQPAFEMGIREAETPQTIQEPYKAPPKARDGFTRDLDEEEIIVCPNCGDELAAGEGEVKQQVWIIKQCGHVYCGVCATNRTLNGGSKREKRRAAQLGGKTSMFQIYL